MLCSTTSFFTWEKNKKQKNQNQQTSKKSLKQNSFTKNSGQW